MKTNELKKHRAHGFSLVELLTVISVIGIMSALAIPSIGNVNTAATKAVNQRNAQSIVSVFQSGTSAATAWVVTSRNAAVADVVAGRSPTTGAFTSQTFKVPNITGTDLTGTYIYIGLDASNNLFYDKAGGQSAT